MNDLRQAAGNIHMSDDADIGHGEKGGLHPLFRVLVTFVYILIVVSFPRYDVTGLAGMLLFLLVHMIWHEISARAVFRRIWPVLLMTGAAGIAALFFDRESYAVFGCVTVTYGMVAMITLMLKGIFCAAASYILAVTVGIGQICRTLRLIHIPEEIVTIIMLLYRYLMMLIKEVERMQQAYRLRAPKQRGLRFKTWGSFVGLLLLRSMDRAEEVYESMKLRGFQGKMQYTPSHGNPVAGILYLLLWGMFFLAARLVPIFQMVGNLLI